MQDIPPCLSYSVVIPGCYPPAIQDTLDKSLIGYRHWLHLVDRLLFIQ